MTTPYPRYPQFPPGPPGPPPPGPPLPPRQSGPGQPARRDCPECGRPVPQQGAKLCPSCGYPLLLDRPAVPEHEPSKIVYKPTSERDDVQSTSQALLPVGPWQPVPTHYAPPPRVGVPGPHCPFCRTVNPPPRKRCEVCAHELWPGAAAPAPWMPEPPSILPPPPRRRGWWKIALLIGVPIAVMAAVWVLALVL